MIFSPLEMLQNTFTLSVKYVITTVFESYVGWENADDMKKKKIN